MPHVNIKHFPSLNKEQQLALAEGITKVLTDVIKCNENAISIALEPIESAIWHETVYVPEIINRKELLCKFPNY